MRLKFCLFIFLIFLMPGRVLSQDDTRFPVRVDTIFVIGNEHTHTDIILREIPYVLPDSLNDTDLLIIRNRIQNLNLFNRVELHLSRYGEQNALIIAVTESWYIFPLPILFINEKDWDKISYGLQFSHYNFRGRNEKLNVGGWLGYNPSFYVTYFNPWIGGHKRIIFGLSAFHNRHANKIFDFDEKRTGFDVILGRRFTLRLQTRLEFSLQRITLPEPFQPYTVTGDGSDYIPTIQYTINYDKRDLYEYPKDGFFLKYEFRRTGFSRNQPEFWRVKFDNRIYKRIYKKISLGVRNLTEINFNDLPIYEMVYIGYSERIRGYFNKVLPAPEEFRDYPSPKLSLSSVELRFPILPIKYISMDSPVDMLSPFTRELKFGLSGGLFMDSGIAWQRAEQLNMENLYTGYGVGLHIHLPYVYLLRLEYAINDAGESEVIFDMGVSF